MNAVGIYVDEVNLTPLNVAFAYDSNLVDLERIEILRGPQGTLFGRNVLGGAVNITTVKPSDTFGGRIEGAYGSFDRRRLRGSLNVPLTDGVYVRGTAYYDARDGWINNPTNPGTTNDRESYGFRGALRLEPSVDTVIDLTASYSEFRGGLNDVIPSGFTAEFFRFTVPIPADPRGAYDGIGFYPENDDTVLTTGDYRQGRDTFIGTVRAEHDFGGVVGILNVGYIDIDRFEDGEDVDLVPGEFFGEFQTEALQSTSVEARIQSDNASGINWLIGANYAFDENRFTGLQPGGRDIIIEAFGFDPLDVDPNFTVFNVGTDDFLDQIESFGVFANVTIPFGADDRWTLDLGARYSTDQVTGRLTRGPDGNTGCFIGDTPENNPNCTIDTIGPEEATFDAITGRASLLFEATPDINLYATIARGTKPGGFNLFAVGQQNVPDTFGSESMWNYEAGVKGTLFDRRVNFSLSAFYMDWTDIQFNTAFRPDDRIAPEIIVLNAGQATVKGVELDFAASVTDNFSIQGGIGYLDAQVGEGEEVAPAIDLNGNEFSIDGNRLPRAPRWTLNLAGEYTVPIGSDLDGFFRVEGSYRSSFFEQIDNGESSFTEAGAPLQLEEVDGYTLVNVRLGIRSDNFRISVYGENLLNETTPIGIRYQISLAGQVIALVRREFGIRAAYEF